MQRINHVYLREYISEPALSLPQHAPTCIRRLHGRVACHHAPAMNVIGVTETNTTRSCLKALRHAFFTVPLAEQHGLSCTADRSLEGWC